MSRQLIDGVWVIVCDWKDVETGDGCNLGLEGNPAMYIDPNGGKENSHFQCGRHHGLVPQKEKEEFQLPEGHKLNQEVISASSKNVNVEDIEDD